VKSLSWTSWTTIVLIKNTADKCPPDPSVPPDAVAFFAAGFEGAEFGQFGIC